MKRVCVDTNFNWFGPDYPGVSHREALELNLVAGERVVAYMEDEEWTGTVAFDPTLPLQYQWYVILDPLDTVGDDEAMS